MTRPTVLMPARMHDVVVDGCAERFELVRLWEATDPDALLAERGADVRGLATGGHHPVDAALLDKLPNLQIVANFGVGYDSVDVDAATERGVVVTNTPGVLDDEVADTALALLLMTVRELGQAERYLRAGRWAAEGHYPLTDLTMTGRKLGILGLGRIGEAIAKRAETFRMTVGYHNRSEKDVPYRYYPSLLEMARDVDTLLVVVPGSAATRHLVDAEVLEALGPDGVLVNIGRGTVVDEAALIGALKTRTIRAAGLDVYEDEPNVPRELIDLDNAVLLPHVGSASKPTRRAMGRLVVDNLTSWFTDGRALTPVNG
ncbi:lactate dehydrogenase-like 2-hydroxyacid dehydrogenase [Pseudonocardia hierapolitana]|uniref:Lactate dehydrogenase-like 2-hydroxyacid dehydrogenase n=1 Tax=Pseudonocardia hierapolitana TaxID=1128676 RepID=A0A561SMG4_9PSEU|nr:2-hydroxyacid dehydrogenase [Pseudonocardia hierapolitana]TWF76051.1 lactate dehydrogenase-like 2-hydroxyacid dehydrogenase [Pseudonocardia hierapolitana]